MAVGVDNPGYWPVTPVLAVQGQGSGRGLGRDQRIDHDHAAVAFHDRHVRQVQPANLVDAPGHLEQALPGAQLGLPPQARVSRLRAVFPQEGERVVVPHHSPAGVLHHARVQRADQSTVGILEIRTIFKRQVVHYQLSPGTRDRRLARLRTGR